MVKQISLDTWSTDRLNELLKKGTNIVTQTNLPIVLYRETLEETEGSYEELICTLTQEHVVAQAETPWPINFFSESSPNNFAEAPVDIIIVLLEYSFSPDHTLNGL